ncbi:HNH endonuclease [Microbacterium sp. NPDC055599]
MTLTAYAELDQGCSVDGCDRDRRTRGWCSSHYTQWRNTGVIPTRPFTVVARFYRYVDKGSEQECWPWLGTVKKNGYGQFWFNGKPDRAHRVSYELTNGEIPEGMLIRHTCDNKRCVNPAHLITGTARDNARDAVERGLYPRGETQGRSKLTLEQVNEIRRNWRERTETQKSMAERFGVSTSAIQLVATGQSWVGLGESS